MSRWFFIIGAVLLAAFAAVYAYWGGFNNPQVELLTTAQPTYLAGRYFKGLPDNSFGKLFAEANELYRKGTLKGTALGNIYYNDPQEEGEPVEAFIGVVMPDTSQRLPVGYRYRAFPAGQRVLRARVEANFMLAPGRLYPALQEAAKKQKLKPRKLFLEQFPDEGPAEMLMGVE